MTTDIHCQFVEDVSIPNPVLAIGVAQKLQLSAEVWSTASQGSITIARLKCLRFALERIINRRLNPQFWFVVAHKAMQPDNKITRYHGLWNSLRRRGLNIPINDSLEVMHKSESGLRFLGATRFEFKDLEVVHTLMASEQAAIIVMDGEDSKGTIASLLNRGWASRNTNPPVEILEVICDHSNLVVDVYGEFDDPEVAAAVIGRKGAIGSCCD